MIPALPAEASSPTPSRSSTIVTSWPALARKYAVVTPTTPAPSTSVFMARSVLHVRPRRAPPRHSGPTRSALTRFAPAPDTPTAPGSARRQEVLHALRRHRCRRTRDRDLGADRAAPRRAVSPAPVAHPVLPSGCLGPPPDRHARQLGGRRQVVGGGARCRRHVAERAVPDARPHAVVPAGRRVGGGARARLQHHALPGADQPVQAPQGGGALAAAGSRGRGGGARARRLGARRRRRHALRRRLLPAWPRAIRPDLRHRAAP